MKKLLVIILLLPLLVMPVSAMELTAPTVPEAGRDWMPENTQSFADGLWQLLEKAVLALGPDLKEAAAVSMGVLAGVIAVSTLQASELGSKLALNTAGAAAVSAMLLGNANTMIRLGAETIQQLSDYGKLFYPVMTAAMAAQGGLTASAALYTGTMAFDMLLGSLISRLLVPMVYLFLALAIANSALGENILKRLRDLVKNTVSWCLKTLLTVFTTYMAITGVVSGATDAATLKATKVTISSVVPVVGGILSDASEAVLVGAGLVKNAAGIYGVLAVLALFLGPFLRIGAHYLTLKAVAAVSGVFGAEGVVGVIDDFSSAMGLLLAMTGASCLLLLISTVCFMKEVG